MKDYYEEIKEELISNEIYKKAKDYSKNKHDLQSYYNVGKLLIEAQGGEERASYMQRRKQVSNDLLHKSKYIYYNLFY